MTHKHMTFVRVRDFAGPADSDPSSTSTFRWMTQSPGEDEGLVIVERPRVGDFVGDERTAMNVDAVCRFLWMKAMTERISQLKKEGKPMPKSIEELETVLGDWRSYKSQAADDTAASSSGGCPCAAIPLGLFIGKPSQHNIPCAVARVMRLTCDASAGTDMT